MRETHFIQQNKNKWAKFERNLGQGNANPDELSELFIEITDDLSYSRTFYPNRSVRVYLNNIAQKVFYSVYKNRKGRLFNFLDFWRSTVPQIIYESRKSFYLAFGLFLLAAFIGVFSSYMDPEFPRVILGDDYIDMTLRNIANGEPMAVYQDPKQSEMFFRIAQNNLMVATLCFIVGLLFGVGTVFVLIQNGIMLGSFQYLFIREGVYLDSFFTIWMHGSIEISCIVIAGAAGITLGSGLVFPKTLSRLQSLQLSARRGLLIMLTILPLIILAAFIEGFITRYTSASYVIRGIVILGSFAFIISYYIVYPWMKARKGFTSFLGDVKLPAMQNNDIQYNQIKNSVQLFGDAFIFYRRLIQPAAIAAAIFAAIYTGVVLWEGSLYEFSTITSFEQLGQNPWALIGYTLMNMGQLLLPGDLGLLWLMNILITTPMVFGTLYYLQADANRKKNISVKPLPFFLKTATATLVCVAAIHFCLLAIDGWLFLAVLFVVPLVMLFLATSFNENTNLLSAMGRSFSLLSGNWVVMMGVYLIMLGMCLIFLFMITAPVAGFYLGVLVNALPVTDLETMRQGFYIFLYTYMFCLLSPLAFIALSIGFYSFRETKEATDLLERIPTIGVRKISYGMEKEA